jgi:hypothetical protein
MTHAQNEYTPQQEPSGAEPKGGGSGCFESPPGVERFQRHPHRQADAPIFIPDAFVRGAVRELAAHLQPISQLPGAREVVFRVNNDMTLSAFFQSMLFILPATTSRPKHY